MTTSPQNKIYVATLTNSGRAGWSVVFRHPLVVDPATGRPPLRIKRGLGEKDESKAKSMADDLNVLLRDSSYWTLSARSLAATRFDTRIVEIFFSPIIPEEPSYALAREKYIPLPSEKDRYKKVLFIGPTGAGKTTLVRQILGTHPENERFPSTSKSRCTVADTEIILSKGTFKAVVTFASQQEIREAVDECLVAAVFSAFRKEGDSDILRRMLNHIEQRFRFSYILGKGGLEENENLDFDLDEEQESEELSSDYDPEQSNEFILSLLAQIKSIANSQSSALRQELIKSEKDKQTADELFEEELDKLLREDEQFQEAGDQIMEAIRDRFDLLDQDCLEVNKHDWPTVWHWESTDRKEFLKEISKFSSNYAPLFGQLLTPLVNGIRVSGNFVPEWYSDGDLNLVLIDVEGLGHSPDSSSTVPSSLLERFDSVDAIVLVDNAEQPMQAAPITALRAVLSSGNVKKLIIAFTHFDQIKAADLANIKDRQSHVLASAESAIRFIGQQLGPQPERDVKNRLETACVFLGGINEELELKVKKNTRTIQNLNRLVELIKVSGEKPSNIYAKAEFDKVNLVLAVKNAAEAFHEDWRGILGLSISSSSTKVHWTKVKALNRRFAEGWDEAYSGLAPIAGLATNLREQIYRLIQSPLRWIEVPDNEEEKRLFLDKFANEISGRLTILIRRRMREERLKEWQTANSLSGTGSTYTRARVIANDVYLVAAPIPDVVPSQDGNSFLREIINAVDEAASKCDVVLR